jgi:tRNA(Ile)-lysidine synthase
VQVYAVKHQKENSGRDDRKVLPSNLSGFELGVRRSIENHGLIESGDHLLVGISGGADSVALIHCLHRLAPCMDVSLTAAHLDHGIRGAEAKEDWEFVSKLAASLDIPFIAESIEIQKLSEPRNLEERARQVRYDFLSRTARSVKADKIAVGHNMNDQAETVLLHLVRGCGISGLSAIRPRTGCLIRPLLETSRRQILEYLEALRVGYREDSSNRSLQYRRNRIRHELIPYLEAWFNPAVIDNLARQADMAREVSEFLDLESERIYGSLKTCIPGGVSLGISKIEQLPVAMKRWILRRGLKEACGTLRGTAARHVEDMIDLCRSTSGRSIQLPGGWIAARQFDRLILSREKLQQEEVFEYMLNIPGRCRVPEAAMEFSARIAEPSPNRADPPTPDRVLLKPETLPDRLHIRSRRPGDRYGGPGHRKVKRILIDAKVPLPERSRLPMVVAGDSVVWIPGFEPAKSFIANPLSGRCVILEVHRDSPETAYI